MKSLKKNPIVPRGLGRNCNSMKFADRCKSPSASISWSRTNQKKPGRGPRAQSGTHVVSLSRNTRYGASLATTPMLATVSPFFIEGTAQTYRTTPLDGACASHTVLPNRSVT